MARRRVGNKSLLVTGIKEIDRKLDGLANKEKRKIVRASTNAGMTAFSKVLRTTVSAEAISPQLKRAMKLTIGRRFWRARLGQDGMAAKVGFGVGKRKSPKRSGRNKSGVGIGSRNVHWFALGTRVRRVKQTGQQVGRIRQVRAMKKAMATGRTLAFSAMKSKAATTLRDVVRTMK